MPLWTQVYKIQVISQQESTCKGVVKDSKGETIIGASVVVKGTSNGTITDFDGNFALSAVKKGATIQISFVGFKHKNLYGTALLFP